MAIQLFLKNKIWKNKDTPPIIVVKEISSYGKKIVIKNTSRIVGLRKNQLIQVAGLDGMIFISKVSYSNVLSQYTLIIQGNVLPTTPFGNRQLRMYDTVQDELSESGEIELSDYDLETITQIKDLTNITSNKEKISKQIVIKGTDNNNRVFGNAFSLNKLTNSESVFRLYDEYNGIKQVDAEVFADGILVFYGKLILQSTEKKGILITNYTCTIIGELNSFKSFIGDANLMDLDLIDLTHTYSIPNIQNSWHGFGGTFSVGTKPTIENFIWETATIVDVPTSYGRGYTYPTAEYGDRYTQVEPFWDNHWNNQYSKVRLQNYRAGVYVEEYLRRIFEQFDFTYEIKGTSEFKQKFQRLILPNTQKAFRVPKNGIVGWLRKNIMVSYNLGRPGAGTTGATRSNDGLQRRALLFHFPDEMNTDMVRLGMYYGDDDYSAVRQSRNTIKVKRSMSCPITLQYRFEYTAGSYTGFDTRPRKYTIQVVKRDAFKSYFAMEETKNWTETYGKDDAEVFDWEVLYESTETVNMSTPNLRFNTIEIPVTDFHIGDEVQVRMVLEPYNPSESPSIYLDDLILPIVKVEQLDIKFGSDTASVMYEPQHNDRVVPMPPDMKQIDLIKALSEVYNLMIYPDPKNEKNIVFETYDSYYEATNPTIIARTALDWSDKVNLLDSVNIKSNVKIPKDYLFTYEKGDDTLNEQYTKQTNKTYSQLDFIDTLGLETKKEVKPIFNSSIPSDIGTHRLQHLYFKGDNYFEREPTELKARLSYHSWVFACNPYDLVEEGLVIGMKYTKDYIKLQVRDIPLIGMNHEYYNLCTNYLMRGVESNIGTPWIDYANRVPSIPVPQEDLHYFRPERFYFHYGQEGMQHYLNFDGAYKYYRNNITEITDVDLKVIELMVSLNAYDLNQLDLKIPIFLDLPEIGSGYFKLITVVTNYDNPLSKVTLQQIL